MRHTIINISWILLIITTLCLSGYLAVNEKEGWGWFLFAAILFAVGFSYNDGDDDKDKIKNQSKTTNL